MRVDTTSAFREITASGPHRRDWAPMPSGRAVLAACLLASLASLAAAAGNTPADSYPFVALIADKEAPLCAGALVAPRVVLTSASCVTASNAAPSIVYIGMLNFFLDEFRREGDYEIHRVEQVVVHPDFSTADLQQNNLALLVLKRKSRHTPVSLPDGFTYPKQATDVTVLGYGSLSADGFFPQLHADQISLLPEEECSGLQTAFGRWWAAPQDLPKDIQACTALSHSFRACASGNKGAPLVLPSGAPGGGGGSSGGPLQLGLLTSGFTCSADPAVASASSPALYTWLPRYSAWLKEQLAAAAGAGAGAAGAEEAQAEAGAKQPAAGRGGAGAGAEAAAQTPGERQAQRQ